MEGFVGRQVRPDNALGLVECWHTLLPDDVKWLTWLPGVLCKGIEEGVVLGGIVENIKLPRRIAAFGLSVFISQQVHDEFFDDPKPYLNARLLQRYRDGEDSVFLGREQQAEGNRGDGLIMMVLEYFSENHNYETDETAHVIGNRILPEYIKCHAGFNIRKNIHETEELYGFLQLAGGQQELLKFDEQATYSMRKGGLGPRAVYGLSRENRADFTVSGLPNIIMNYQRPNFNLMPREQETVLLGIEGLTDVAIADKLGVSRDAIKQRWRGIYGQIESVEPDFFLSNSLGGNGVARGNEKRRHVIAALSQRMEELRPYCIRRGWS